MIVDSHLHLLQSKNFEKETWDRLGMPFPHDTKLNDLIKWLEYAGVEKAVVMGQDMTRIWHSQCGEDYVMKAVKEYPDKFIGLASLEPLDRYNRLNEKALQYFEEAVKRHGLRGVLLTPPYGHYRSNDKQVYPFYEKAVELEAVVQYHHSAQTGPSILAPLKYADISLVNDVTIDFPKMKIVIEHLGYPWTEMLFTMMVCNPNIYADLAMMYDRPTIVTWNLVMAKEYGVIDRIMYASDYWSWGQGVFSNEPAKDFKRYIDWIRNGLNKVAEKAGWPTFSQSEIDGILGNNAKKLYGL